MLSVAHLTWHSELFSSLGWLLHCCQTSKISRSQHIYISTTMTRGKVNIFSLPLIKTSILNNPTHLTTTTAVACRNLHKIKKSQVHFLEGVSTSKLPTVARSCWVGWNQNKTKKSYGCCQWSPVQCQSSGGCQLTWKLQFPRCREAEWLSAAAHWRVVPSMLPELLVATDCSLSPP